MPQEPKRRHSKARKRTRRASIFLQATALVSCKIIDLTPFMQCYNKATSKSYDYAKADCKRFGVQERFFTELK